MSRKAALFSQRFAKQVVVTRHARLRMAERDIDDALRLDIIDQGDTRFRDPPHLWAFKAITGWCDNPVCAVLVLEDAVVVKAVMHHFELT